MVGTIPYNNNIDIVCIIVDSMNQPSHKPRQPRPPLCPRTEKASTIRLQSPTSNTPSLLKKNQRLTHQTNTNDSAARIPSNTLQVPRSPTTSPLPPLPPQKDDIRRSQYQQFTRRNYLRPPREGEGHPASQVTQKLVVRHSPSEDEERRLKSKSALNYAKYFIKQVSSIPTEPSSQQPSFPINPVQPYGMAGEMQLSKEQSTTSRGSQERGRLTHREKLSQRLKSLKSVRARSNKRGCSIQRQILPSSEKPGRGDSNKIVVSKPGKLAPEAAGRNKARSRNRRVVLKVRQQGLERQQEVSLLLSSKIDKTQGAEAETSQKIELHLELLNLLPAYVKQFKQIYQEVDCWDELLFLTYKKFFLQRLKVHQALGFPAPACSPFRFPFALVTPSELRVFSQSLAGLHLQQRVGQENDLIRRALQQVYNHIIEKSGRSINLLEQDNFSEEVYWLMGEEVRLLSESEGDQAVVKARIDLTAKCCLLIAFLNGEDLEIEPLLTDTQSREYRLQHLELFLQGVGQ